MRIFSARGTFYCLYRGGLFEKGAHSVFLFAVQTMLFMIQSKNLLGGIFYTAILNESIKKRKTSIGKRAEILAVVLLATVDTGAVFLISIPEIARFESVFNLLWICIEINGENWERRMIAANALHAVDIEDH